MKNRWKLPLRPRAGGADGRGGGTDPRRSLGGGGSDLSRSCSPCRGPADELAQVRAATARFHRVEEAIEAGYELGWVNGSGVRIITGCVAHPTAGAMGYHYINEELMDDLVADPPRARGARLRVGPGRRLKLVAVEWIVRGPSPTRPASRGAPPPTVLGMDMHILVPPPGRPSTSCTPGSG